MTRKAFNEQDARAIVAETVDQHAGSGPDQWRALLELAAQATHALATLLHANEAGNPFCPLCRANDEVSIRAHVLAGAPSAEQSAELCGGPVH
jgi:hypothetical protein